MKSILQSALIKKVAKSFTLYTTANLMTKAIPFLLLPVLTRVLSPSDYGLLATFIAIVGIVNVIASMGSVEAVTRGYFDQHKEGFDFAEFVFNAIVINIGVFLLLNIAVVLLKSVISVQLSLPFSWSLLIPLIGLCSAVYLIPFKMLVIQKKPVPYGVLQISNMFMEVLLSIVFVVFIGMGWPGRVVGMSLTKVVFLFIGIYILVKKHFCRISVSATYIKAILRYGIPIVFHSLGFVVVVATGKFFLNRLVGLSATGFYSVGASVAAIIGFFVGSFNLAWMPFLYERLARPTEELKRKLVKLTYIYFFAILSATGIFVLISPGLLKVMVGKNFFDASQYLAWVAFGYALHGMYTMVVNYIFYEKKTHLLSLTAVVTIVLNVVFNYTLIKLNGAIGAAQATFLTFLARFVLIWYFSGKVYPMPWFSFFKRRAA